MDCGIPEGGVNRGAYLDGILTSSPCGVGPWGQADGKIDVEAGLGLMDHRRLPGWWYGENDGGRGPTTTNGLTLKW